MKLSSLATWSGKNRIFAHVLARGKKDDCSNKMLGDGINPTGGTDLAPVAKECDGELADCLIPWVF